MCLKKYLLLTAIFLGGLFPKSAAQTCTGSLGDPIINIDFGSGPNFGPPLAAGTTSSLGYQASTCPSDGYYSIVNYTSGCWPNDVVWHTATDHTGNSDGYYMLINASNDPSNFYIQTIDGLCGGTTYQFAAWMLNMCSVTGTLPNITFTIENIDGSILNTYNTGDIPILNPVTWKQYGLFFTTPPGVSKVVLRMRNNSPGGVGNDLGLDDITFRPAGPAIAAFVDGYQKDTLDLCTYDTLSLHFNSTVENCYGSTAYQWQLSMDEGASWNTIAGATGNAYTRTSAGAGNFLYRLTVAQTANIGITTCRVASNPIRLNVHRPPIATINGSAATCAGEIILLTAGGGTVYQWTGPAGFTSETTQVSVTNADIINAGKYRVTVSDSTGCNAADSINVAVYPRPQALFSFADPLCENSTVLFTDQSVTNGSPLSKWSWAFGDGAVAGISAPSHIFAQAGSYRVSLQVQNSQGCKSDTLRKNIEIHPLPKPGFGLPGICLTDPFASFTDSSSIADNSELQFLYAWNFGDNAATSGNPNTSFQKDPRHSYSSTGIYPVRLTITSKDGCAKDTVKNFSVNGSQPVAKFDVDPGVDFCSGKDVVIINQATVNFGNITKVEMYWDYQGGLSVKTTDSFPFVNKKYAYSYPYFGSPLTKPVAIKYVVYSGISCVNEYTQQLVLKAAPALQLDSFYAVCEDVKAFALTQGKELNGLVGVGYYSGAGITGDSLFDPSAATAGLHTIRYSFLAGNGCTAFVEKPVQVLAKPVADAGPDQTILSGANAVIGTNQSSNGLQYEWTPNITINDIHSATPVVSPNETISYNLSVTSDEGCKANDQVIITVVKDIYVPSAFSPNGDGINDTWRIPFMQSYTGATVDVFNRFGQLVYHSSGSTNGWDGKFNGKQLPLASYTWIIHPGNGRKLLHGTVTIVR